ncbi:hypothetical protein DL96DRAFT_1630839 [Flagelloscypha sp. PMI_526]|nr:hypothetical protein DL96DRAFT_1630839 [Flagelloscypha sp. PMI_526]
MLVNSDKPLSDTSAPPVPDKELPPAYDHTPSPSGSSSPSQTRQFPVPEHVQPSNLLHLSATHQPIKDKYIINPNLAIPRALLPPLNPEETEQTRANLSLVSTHSYVTAEVWTLSDSKPPAPNVVRINAKSTHSYVHIILHDDTHTRPLRINCHSTHGKVKLYLPRSFVGMISGSTKHGKVEFSPAIRAKGTLLGNIENMSRIFIGDLDLYHEEREGEEGSNGLDEADLSAPHAGLTVYFEDEAPLPQPNPFTQAGSGSGIFGSFKKMFGGSSGTSVETTNPRTGSVQSPTPQADLDAKVRT